jgi:membrane-associated phospholipid phosphatase
MMAASYAGIGGAVWLAVGALLTLAGTTRFRDFVRLVVAISLVHISVDLLLKPWIDRPRPPLAIAGLDLGVDVPETRSFPSGHAANAMAAALVLVHSWRRGRAPVWTCAVIVAVARVYLGIHYPLDALAGSLTGLACGWLALHAPPGEIRYHGHI